MKVVLAQPQMLPIVAALFDRYRQYYQQASEPAAVEAFLRERFERGDSRIFIALDEQGKAQGFVQLYPTYSSIAMQRTWCLNDLYVEEKARRAGVGQALLAAAGQLARTTGAVGVKLTTPADNHAAKGLYQKAGFSKLVDFDQYVIRADQMAS